MINVFRRSIYLILSGLMGLLIFFILHRIAIFLYLLIVTSADVFFEYNTFLLWDYITLSFSMVVGLVYGMWIGEYWYKVVYHENTHNGLIDHIGSFFTGKSKSKPEIFENKLEHVALRLENNLNDLEALAKQAPAFLRQKTSVKPLKTRRTALRSNLELKEKVVRSPKARKKI
ncbi:MAG: hypothetical protein JNN11_03880 [Candidatus Doudnabacteria bacterium]|nr:hypothetical protein [Candidatus Doudnabacteria bacterium]